MTQIGIPAIRFLLHDTRMEYVRVPIVLVKMSGATRVANDDLQLLSFVNVPGGHTFETVRYLEKQIGERDITSLLQLYQWKVYQYLQPGEETYTNLCD